MIDFVIRVADITIGAWVIYKTTREYCHKYLCGDTPEFSVSISPEDIQKEREKSRKEALLEGLPIRDFSDSQLEITALQRKIADCLLERDILLFHGSVISVDGKAYLFTAKSGTGKSTHTRLWREVFGEKAIPVNDDKPFLHICEDKVIAYGTPWNGKHKIGNNISVPLKAICVLERGTVNSISELNKKSALPLLIQQSYRPNSPQKILRCMDLIDRLTKNVEFYKLSCNMEPEAAIVSYEGMSGEKWRKE